MDEKSISTPVLNILAADDDEIALKLIEKQLTKLGHTTKTAITSDHLFNLLESKENFDIIFLDLEFAPLSGLEIAKSIRENQYKLPKQPYLVALSGHHPDLKKEACLAAGINDYQCKPVRSDDFKRIINQFLVARTQSRVKNENYPKLP